MIRVDWPAVKRNREVHEPFDSVLCAAANRHPVENKAAGSVSRTTSSLLRMP